MYFAVVASTTATVCEAGQVRYFSLGGPGAASVHIGDDDRRACLLDGGNAGERGIGGVRPDGRQILDWLEQQGVKHLVVLCSHPHSDHLAGLKELVGDYRNFVSSDGPPTARFASVTFIDATVADRLAASYLHSVTAAAQHGVALPEAKYITAHNRNAFAGMFSVASDLRMETWAYRPERPAGVHGNAVVTLTQLSAGTNRRTIVDFDDAEDGVVRRFLASRQRNRDPVDVVVLPHHGSKSNDVRLLLNALRPRAVIIHVDPNNPYLHPGVSNLTRCVERLGPENVHLTALGDISVTAHALVSTSGREQLTKFVGLLRDRIEEAIVRLSERSSDRTLWRLLSDREQLVALEHRLGVDRSTRAAKASNVLREIALDVFDKPTDWTPAEGPLTSNRGDYMRGEAQTLRDTCSMRAEALEGAATQAEYLARSFPDEVLLREGAVLAADAREAASSLRSDRLSVAARGLSRSELLLWRVDQLLVVAKPLLAVAEARRQAAAIKEAERLRIDEARREAVERVTAARAKVDRSLRDLREAVDALERAKRRLRSTGEGRELRRISGDISELERAIRDLEIESREIGEMSTGNAPGVQGDAREAETRAREAETKAREAETKAREAETVARGAETKAREAETKIREAESRAREFRRFEGRFRGR